MTTTITVGGNSVSLVSMPEHPAPKQIDFTVSDAVAMVTSIFTGQVQTQAWAGADALAAKLTFPPLFMPESALFKAWLMEMRGVTCAVQIGDPDAQTPQGMPQGSPLVDGSVSTNNAAGATEIVTKGWKPEMFRLLLPGDAIQIGYRMYYVVNPVDSDANGAATLNIWPSIREQPADGTAIQTARARGLFRLASNARTWSLGLGRATSVSVDLIEYR